MSYEYSENILIEAPTMDLLASLGWECVLAYNRETFGSDSLFGRMSKAEVVLNQRLGPAIQRLNPDLPEQAYEEAVNQITGVTASKDFVGNNHEKYLLFKKGVSVTYKNEKGEIIRDKKLRIFDFADYANNDFLAVQQLWVKSNLYTRRPDVLLFVNGIPLVFIELKALHVSVENAFYDNLKDYKDAIPHLFHYNAFVVLSNGEEAKIGSITSRYEHFNDWKRLNEEDEGEVDLERIIQGTCRPDILMDLFENFLLFDTSGGKTAKLIARNHQYLGVNRAIESVRNLKEQDGKLGVFWHTQGSGKSYSMVFFCQKIHRKLEGNFTFLIVTDRKELDKQIYENFSGVGAVTTKQVRAENGEHLKSLLQENHRYIFTLIHKFYTEKGQEYPKLSDRDDIIVISDEAHRSQYGTLALNMRNALPNAAYIGFTGTPLISDELELTKNIFGDYVSIYDFKRSIDDGSTVPLYYENRGDKLQIEQPEIDEEMAEILEDENLSDEQRLKLERQFSQSYPIITSNKRLDTIAKDIIWHFFNRGFMGKAMVVCIDKPTAVKMYDKLEHFKKAYLQQLEAERDQAIDDQDLKEKEQIYRWADETEMAVVVSQEQNEVDRFRKLGLNIAQHREKIVQRNLEKEFKDEDRPFRIAIVCAMWITGFDVPSLSTLYIDKPLKGHTLMQAIARANRVHEGKNNGTIVDYINVYRSLQKALAIYGKGDNRRPDEIQPDLEGASPVNHKEKLVEELREAIAETREYLQDLDFDLDQLIEAKGFSNIPVIKAGADKVSLNDHTRKEFEKLARKVFRKYKGLLPGEEERPFRAEKNAIEAIYNYLQRGVREADITQYMMRLQAVVDEKIQVNFEEPAEEIRLDLSRINFEKLKDYFETSRQQNTDMRAMKELVEDKMQEMLQQNPSRLDFYKKYQDIIDDYNKAKDKAAIEESFRQLMEFVEELSEEDTRALREGLDEESLAIFDLLVKDDLSRKERSEVKKVARELLEELKKEKLRHERWRESTQLSSQVRTYILNKLYYLPEDKYPDQELADRRDRVYQFIFERYGDGVAA
jgi:type I restriction enzyme R subunit